MPWCSIEIQQRGKRKKKEKKILELKILLIVWLDQIFSYGLFSKHPLGHSAVSHLFQSYQHPSTHCPKLASKKLFCARSIFTQSRVLCGSIKTQSHYAKCVKLLIPFLSTLLTDSTDLTISSSKICKSGSGSYFLFKGNCIFSTSLSNSY